MKREVDCPNCGPLHLVKHDRVSWLNYASWFACLDCGRGFTEAQMLNHMRDKPGMDRNAPAFRALVKPKSRSDAAKAVFGE